MLKVGSLIRVTEDENLLRSFCLRGRINKIAGKIKRVYKVNPYGEMGRESERIVITIEEDDDPLFPIHLWYKEAYTVLDRQLSFVF